MEGESGAQRHGGIRDRQTPQGTTETWVQANVGKGRITPSQETEAEVGTRRGAQRRAVEAGGWRVRAMSRWTALCTGRGGGGRVKTEKNLTMNSCRWRVGKKEDRK